MKSNAGDFMLNGAMSSIKAAMSYAGFLGFSIFKQIQSVSFRKATYEFRQVVSVLLQ